VGIILTAIAGLELYRFSMRVSISPRPNRKGEKMPPPPPQPGNTMRTLLSFNSQPTAMIALTPSSVLVEK